jgi:SOS-response transcriptional repressor LexA
MQWIIEKAQGRRMRLLAYLYQYRRDNYGYCPSIQEMVDSTSYTTKSTVSYALSQLDELGYLRIISDKGRTLRIIFPGESIHIPVFDEERFDDAPVYKVRRAR